MQETQVAQEVQIIQALLEVMEVLTAVMLIAMVLVMVMQESVVTLPMDRLITASRQDREQIQEVELQRVQ